MELKRIEELGFQGNFYQRENENNLKFYDLVFGIA